MQNSLDDFTIAQSRLLTELRVVELANMVRLCRIKRFADFRKNLDMLVERKRKAENVISYAVTSDFVRANLRAMNVVRPVSAVLSNIDHSHGNSGSNSSNGHRRVKQECFWYVSHGSDESSGSLQELQAGQDVDVFLGNEWVVGRVLRLRKDRNFIRQAKVSICEVLVVLTVV